ncbi:hypothetical protein E4V42_03785 [Clostridium estertheticum]|uniref:Uncharacterized protein n=1 Tax=Clostridium estertheticum TaxID=238834 RepID=A0A5N7IJT3_9CLOT|nr:hypothetical protein [Clostridium estertheticum]MPQ30557.1 hypothetical protein [Clostridium estertheticum]MPQ61233.1 hypothetical protein [Clostridium estertheticum]
MKRRKYLSEFGLNVFTSYKTIIPVEHLNIIKDGHDYHIYSIMSCPKVRYVKDSFKASEECISLTLEKQIKDSVETIEIQHLVLDGNLDHTKLGLACLYPYNKLNIEINDNEWLNTFGRGLSSNKISLEAQGVLDISGPTRNLEFEILYIGQAFGKDGERIATDRLKSHSTLQKILTDYYSSHPDKQLYIFLFEFTPQLQMSFDGLTRIYTATQEEEDSHFNDVMSNPLKYNQIINITEAAMINYFKPPYNVNFVDNFPDEEHKGYSQYYDLDYNNLVVEIDLEFDGNFYVQLCSETNRINSSFDFIQYDLFNDPNRKSMCDIFKSDGKRDDM